VSEASVRFEGDLYLTLEAVADVYRVDVVWLRRVYDAGLVGRGIARDATVCIPAVRLDRVATIVRYHYSLGLDLDAIELQLEDE
jgi:hypothetical protein